MHLKNDNSKNKLKYSPFSAICYIPFGFLIAQLFFDKDSRMKKSIMQGLLFSVITIFIGLLFILLSWNMYNYGWLDEGFLFSCFKNLEYFQIIKFFLYSIIFIIFISYIITNSIIGIFTNIFSDKYFKIFFVGWILR